MSRCLQCVWRCCCCCYCSYLPKNQLIQCLCIAKGASSLAPLANKLFKNVNLSRRLTASQEVREGALHSIEYLNLKESSVIPPRGRGKIKNCFKNWNNLPIFLYFSLFNSVKRCSKKLWLDLNHGHLVLEATNPPTEPQPLTPKNIY